MVLPPIGAVRRKTVVILQCFLSNWRLWRVHYGFWRVGLRSQRWPSLAVKPPPRITPLKSFTRNARFTHSSVSSGASRALVDFSCTSAQTGEFGRSTLFKALAIPLWTGQRRQRFSGGFFVRAAPRALRSRSHSF